MLRASAAYHISASMFPLRTAVALTHAFPPVSFTAATATIEAVRRISTFRTRRFSADVALEGAMLSCAFAVARAPPKLCTPPRDEDADVALAGATDPPAQTKGIASSSPTTPRRSTRRKFDLPDTTRMIDSRAPPRDRLRHMAFSSEALSNENVRSMRCTRTAHQCLRSPEGGAAMHQESRPSGSRVTVAVT